VTTAAGHEPRVGPNAITQLAGVLSAFGGQPALQLVFNAAGLAHYVAAGPEAMIPQREAIAAHRALYAALPHVAEALAYEAGLRTGDYLLAHRIPKLAQALLKLLPRAAAAAVLLKAIAAHAWTFAGSGRFSARRLTGGCVIEIAANPLATNPCAWHRGVFTRLFRALISPQARVTETACCGDGAPACVFEVRWLR
jgi:divinyl protochlorophyllide a 8-vinyl-reductase